MLKFAFLGAWHSHAVMHVREAAERPEEFELVGMYDADAEVIKRNQEKWEEYGLDIPVFETIEEVLGSEAEAVVVEGHVYENLDYVEQALNAGKHVLMEKPAGVDLVQLEKVHGLAEEQGLVLQMAYMWRYNPAVDEMLSLVREGVVGQVFLYRGHIPKPLGIPSLTSDTACPSNQWLEPVRSITPLFGQRSENGNSAQNFWGSELHNRQHDGGSAHFFPP